MAFGESKKRKKVGRPTNLEQTFKKLDQGLIDVTALANEIGISPELVSYYKTGAREIPPKISSLLERATNGEVTRQECRPNDWHLIWPELAEKDQAHV